MGNHVAELVVKECKASEFADCDIVFSGLDAEVAGDIGKNSCGEEDIQILTHYRDGVPQG